MTKLKFSDNTLEELVALFQRRWKFNTENDYGYGYQTYSGLCQVTSNGKVEDGETEEKALQREIFEELGEKVCKKVSNSKLIKIHENIETNGNKHIVWATILHKDVLKDMQLNVSIGGIEIIKKSDLPSIREKKFSSQKTCVKNTDEIVLFETPVSAVKKAFEIFEKQ